MLLGRSSNLCGPNFEAGTAFLEFLRVRYIMCCPSHDAALCVFGTCLQTIR